MDFYSAYAQGFARVAACTVPVAIADPATNAESVLAQARECHAEGVAVAVFPELCLTGYAVDDLFLQDVLLDLNRSGSVVRSTSVMVLSTLIEPRVLPLLATTAADRSPRAPAYRGPA